MKAKIKMIIESIIMAQCIYIAILLATLTAKIMSQ